MKRLQEDLKKMHNDPPPGIHADFCSDNLFEWDVIISGPGRTCFEGGVFRFKVQFPQNYPETAPHKWSREYDISTVLVAIQAMLGEPNPASPANSEASEMYKNNRPEYERGVMEIVLLSEEYGASSVGHNFNEAAELGQSVQRISIY